MDSFTLNTTAAYHFGIFPRILSNEQSCCCSLHLSVLHHRNWRASCSVVDPDVYEAAKLSIEYWRTCYYNSLYFYLSWLSTDPEQRTNRLRRAFIFRIYIIGIGEPWDRVLNLTTTKSLIFISNIDGPLTTTVSIFIWVDFPQIPSNEPSCCWSRYQKTESKTL